MLISILDSYISYVAVQLQRNNAQVYINGAYIAQPVCGTVFAHDWPEAPVQEGALYLVVLRVRPTGRSKTQRQYVFTCQWTWLLIGTDILDTQQAANRGDRYMADLQMMQNLKEANYPGFCQKMDYAANPATGAMSAVPSMSVIPVSATERILWTDLDFMPRQNKSGDSGVLYNAASVTVTGWDDMAAYNTVDLAATEGPQILTEVEANP